MINLNRVDLIGNLGTDPEMRFTKSGKPVTSFRLACHRRYMKENESVEETDWFTVITWNRLAENCSSSLKKGHLVYVSGRVYLHEWETQDETKASRLEVNGYSVIFLTKKDDAELELEPEPEDLPF